MNTAIECLNRSVHVLLRFKIDEAVVLLTGKRSLILVWGDAFANGDTGVRTSVSQAKLQRGMGELHVRFESSEQVSDFTVMLRLIDHFVQSTDIESPALVIYHIFEMTQGSSWTLLNAPAIASTGGIVAIAGPGVPVTPSIEGVLVLAAEAAVLLFLGLAWSDLNGSSVYLGIQGGNSAVGCLFVAEVDEAVAGVPRTHGINRDVDTFCLIESMSGKEVLDVVGARLVR